MSEIKTLPLPTRLAASGLKSEIVNFAERLVEHNVAAKDAEIERLRALLLEACDDGDEADADLLATLERARTAEARAERLAEALREALECGNDGDWQSARQYITAALRDHDQEEGSGAFWGSSPKSGGPDWTGFDG